MIRDKQLHLASGVTHDFGRQKDRGQQMIDQVQYVDGFGQHAVFEHDRFFDDVRHRPERGQQQERGNDDEWCVWQFVEPIEHCTNIAYGYGRLWYIIRHEGPAGKQSEPPLCSLRMESLQESSQWSKTAYEPWAEPA